MRAPLSALLLTLPLAPPLALAFALAGCSDAGQPGDTTPVVLDGAPVRPVPERDAWPTEGWPTASPADVGLDADALAKLDAYAFARNGDDDDRHGQRTNALVIVKDGRLVYERYARTTTPDTPLLTWSVSKSVGNSLIGAAVHEGLIDVNAPAARYYPPMDRPGLRDVRVTDLLRMSSGIAWAETYETSPIFSDVMAMLYTRGRHDMPAFVASHPLAHPPGTSWSYSSGDANLLMAVLRGAVGEDRYADYPWTALFDPIGMEHVAFERDAGGTFVGSSYVYAPALATAKWAWLHLNDGVWDGRRVLAEGWVRYTTTMAPAFYTTPVGLDHYTDNPGAQLYLNKGDPARDLPPPWPSLPDDAFGASGHWGKGVWIIPSWDMVVVRMGDDREYGCANVHQPDCVPDQEKAFTKPYFLELLAATVTGGGQ